MRTSRLAIIRVNLSALFLASGMLHCYRHVFAETSDVWKLLIWGTWFTIYYKAIQRFWNIKHLQLVGGALDGQVYFFSGEIESLPAKIYVSVIRAPLLMRVFRMARNERFALYELDIPQWRYRLKKVSKKPFLKATLLP